MIYIEKLILDPESFIKKDLLINIKINELTIKQIDEGINYDSKKFKINNENIEDYKKYIENNDPKDFKNIKGYDLYYNFIVEKILDEMFLSKDENNYKVYDLSKLDPLFFKSPKYAFLYIESKINNKEELDSKTIKKLEKALLQDFKQAEKYARGILKNRWEELELKIMDQDDPKFFQDYNYALISIFMEIHDNSKEPDSNSKKFDEFYNKSSVFKDFINHPLTIKNGLSSFDFWNPNIDRILEKFPESYIEYYYSIHKSNDFERNLLKMKENIMKDPEKIAIYYADPSHKVNLPQDRVKKQKIFDALSQHPNHLIFFAYNRYKENDNDIFKYFPNFINDAIKSKDIHMFYYFLSIIITKKIDKNEKMKEIRDYMYQTYKPFIEKIGNNPYYALKYVQLTNYPFPIKEGEEKILNSMLQKRDYLFIIKNLGPSVVPNYNDYDFSILNQEDEDEMGILL
jgi:hypothetical protein